MSSIIQEVFASSPFALTLFTHDLAASKRFYNDALGLAVVFEDEVSVVFGCGSTMINLLAESESEILLAPAKLGDAANVRAIYTLRCSDVDAATAALVNAGVSLLNGPLDRPWGVRTASFQDPSGHTWELANHN